MGKKENDATASEKLLELYNLLLFSSRPLSHAELASELNCSKSSITRYIGVLEKLYPSFLEKQKSGNSLLYRLINKRARRASISLSVKDLELLEMSKNFNTQLPLESKQMLSHALDKIITTFKEPYEMEEFMPTNIPILTNLKGRINYDDCYENLTKVMKAIKNKKICIIEHINGKESEVAFLRLLSSSDALYAQGYFVPKTGEIKAIAPMLFYIHRMKEVIITPRKHPFSLNDDFERTFGLMEGETFQARVNFRGYVIQYVKDRIFSDDQTFEDLPDESTTLTFTAKNRYELTAWILSFGADATLLEPADIVEEIKSNIAIMQNNYA